MSEVRDYSALLSGYTLNAKARTLATGAPVFVTYSFPTTVTDEVKLTDPGAAYTWAGFNSAEITFARAALKAWGDASGITFIETKVGKGDITFNWLDFDLVGASDAAAYAYYPDIAGGLDASLGVHPVGSDVFLSRDLRNTDFQDRDYLMHVLLHEIGHAVGLKHPFEASDYNSKILAASLDDTRHTVMSYNGEDSSLGPFDLQAVAAMYGSNANDASNIASWSWNDTAQTLTQVGRSVDDYILGISAIDVIDGKEGIDTIHGLGGADRIEGGSGNDKIYGDDGNDVLNGGLGGDKLFGGAGDDIFSVPTGRDTLDGGAGIDTLDLSTLTKGIDFYYATLKFGSEVVKVNYVEKIIGGSGNDTIQAYYLLDSDYIFMGGAGDDVLSGGQGRDRLDGGSGFDIAFLGGALGATVDLAIRGAQKLGQDSGAFVTRNYDTFVGIEGLTGTEGNDTLFGNGGNNYLGGGGANDILDGRGGRDTIEGNRGDDRMTGGAGRDIFVFGADIGQEAWIYDIDTITDFEKGYDKIDLTAPNAMDGIGGSHENFAWIGNAEFSGAVGELRYYVEGGNTIIEGSTWHEDYPLTIVLLGTIALDAGDFLLA